MSNAYLNRKIVCLYLLPTVISILSCTIQKKIGRSAQSILKKPALATAHVGITIYEPASGKYWFNYQGDHYFVPASNTKIPTCYAAMKYLGDSLVGLKYCYSVATDSDDIILVIQPSGDPTLLHPDFGDQPAWRFLMTGSEKFKDRMAVLDTAWEDQRWGDGWSWNDYNDDYMVERNSLPIFGNLINGRFSDEPERNRSAEPIGLNLFRTQCRFFDSLVNKPVTIDERLLDINTSTNPSNILLTRRMEQNEFDFVYSKTPQAGFRIPFVTQGNKTAIEIISQNLGIQFGYLEKNNTGNSSYYYYCPGCRNQKEIALRKWHLLYSQPTDSVLKPMMHRSDNFFAEQSLLMVSNHVLGVMSDEKIIDTLLKTDFKDLPQKPRWADGSGLSRYNLFSPQDLVFILNKMKDDFGMDRIKNIFPTGGEGTLTSHYLPERGSIFAKTGNLSGVICISGFLYTKKNKLLIFSALVNNSNGSSAGVRKAVEEFIEGIRERY